MKKNNLFYIITYIFAILITFLGAVFYRQSLLIILLLLMILLPVLSIAATRAAARRLSISVQMPQNEISLPNDLKVTICLQNSSVFPLLNCSFQFVFQNRYYPLPPMQELVLYAEGKNKREFCLPFRLSAAGMFSFRIEAVRITDFLHFYSFQHPFRFDSEIPVLPAKKELALPPLNKALIESEESESSPEGELTQDLLQLREYRPGDRLKDIHWKMTAKTDELSVKEYERSKDLYYLLLLEADDNKLQESLSVFYNMGLQFIKERESFRVAIYHPGDCSFNFLKVSNEEDLLRALYSLYLEPAEHRSTAYESLCSQYPGLEGVIRIHNGAFITPEMPEVY